ncbi:PEPxxWA-CTERM sorting domain-containing protein [Sphingomonas flavalba]|uniref:PEPxxWA-CTERM sorting domain-containing protein n=1 Tax=Sphingomonas flavalba TaxID=2559804 RepID=UPI001EF13575|nr:PEPxxWA-CTERM sorting domain-containing protein [Sphingomonas flavalba]
MRNLGKTIVMSGVVAAFGAGLLPVDSARAEYFVRPVLQYYGGMEDGLSINDLTSNSATFNDGFTHLEAHVDLGQGTIKTYLEMNGPTDVFAVATGVMRDQIVYTGDSNTPVSFLYEYDSEIFADQLFTGTPPEFETRYIGIEAHFAIYEAGSNATWKDWTVFGTHAAEALFVDHEIATFKDEPENFYTFFTGALGSDLYLTSGKAYDVFAAFNLIVTPGTLVGSITMNSLNTSTISIAAPGGSFTSESGQFLGFAQTPQLGGVPEPAAWALLIAGFGLVGGALRSRRRMSVSDA